MGSHGNRNMGLCRPRSRIDLVTLVIVSESFSEFNLGLASFFASSLSINIKRCSSPLKGYEKKDDGSYFLFITTVAPITTRQNTPNIIVMLFLMALSASNS